jgi:hypothetical protein
MITIGSHLSLPNGEELDLLFIDKNGTLTIAELKRDKTPRDVVAQILDYASSLYLMSVDELERIIKQKSEFSGGFQDIARKIIENFPEADVDAEDILAQIERSIKGKEMQLLVVSYRIDDDIRRVTDFLREVYEMKIYCVEFDYFADEYREYFVPEIIGAEEVSRIGIKNRSPTQIEYQRFYSELLDSLKSKIPTTTRRKALPQSYLGLPIGYSGIHLEWAFHGKPRGSFEVGLHFERTNKDENIKLLNLFKDQESQLKNELGEDITFDSNFGKCWTRIYTLRQGGDISDELKKWAIETMVKYYETMKPILDKHYRSYS